MTDWETLVLDSEALSQLARTSPIAAKGLVHAALTLARDEDKDVVIPAAVLAEQYRGGSHDAAINAWLNTNSGAVTIIATDAALARQVGHVLADAKRGSADHVDATVIAAALSTRSPSLILTSDPIDLTALAPDRSAIAIRSLNPTPGAPAVTAAAPKRRNRRAPR